MSYFYFVILSVDSQANQRNINGYIIYEYSFISLSQIKFLQIVLCMSVTNSVPITYYMYMHCMIC